ncbi:hypothetical protein HAX54_025960 [Datura stramonium]|uniref:Uncharacterized protein n=1 Tax=Datura stramonium TaxID=4076 RepID=A0ABS8V2I1_DATST|nr:hypothetical protein [Datura stramonium]
MSRFLPQRKGTSLLGRLWARRIQTLASWFVATHFGLRRCESAFISLRRVRSEDLPYSIITAVESLTTKFGMDWCGSSTPRTPEYPDRQNEERHERKAYWLVIVRPHFLTGGDTKGLCPSIPCMDREGAELWFFMLSNN